MTWGGGCYCLQYIYTNPSTAPERGVSPLATTTWSPFTLSACVQASPSHVFPEPGGSSRPLPFERSVSVEWINARAGDVFAPSTCFLIFCEPVAALDASCVRVRACVSVSLGIEGEELYMRGRNFGSNHWGVFGGSTLNRAPGRG